MEVKLTYTKKELEDLCKKDAEEKFGKAPPLKEWSAVHSYTSTTVELIDMELRPEPPPTGSEALNAEVTEPL